jgi:hypothetical protein
MNGDRWVCGAYWCPCRTEPGSPCRTRFEVARIYRSAALPSANDPNAWSGGRAAKRAETEMKIVRYRQLVDWTADEELVTRIRTQIAELEQKLREIGE